MAIKVNIIEEQWDNFVKECFPPTLPKQQYMDLRRTFYAGAAAFLAGCMAALDDKMPDADLVQNIQRELREFSADVILGVK